MVADMEPDGQFRSRLHPDLGRGRRATTSFRRDPVVLPPAEPSYEDQVALMITELYDAGVISIEECLRSIAQVRSGQ